ncbi:DUF2079 domain-containing protein [Streptacidiphilus pinicola]|uniref:DUF2079 domain-containing protein n=1 Tax=Streptacidiphilus pinicola TaxID=2219663 RepID=UPI001FB21A03|nr:DUF2079 domain-containing protein [Streptacidiphilus pinicola]
MTQGAAAAGRASTGIPAQRGTGFGIGIGSGVGQVRHRLVAKRATWPYLLLGLLFCAVYSVIELSRYLHDGAMSWDTAIFVEEVRQYADFHAPIVHIKGADANILGDHFSPIVALLAPLWWLFPSTVTLLLAQSVLFAGSVTVVAATAGRFLGRTKGICLGVAYGLSWGIQRAVDFDFHEICFAVPILAVVLRNVLLRRFHRAAFWALPLTLVKEDLGVTVVAVGLLLFLLRERALGVMLAIFGAGMTALTVWGVIPHFSSTAAYAYRDKLPGGAFAHLLTGLLSPADVKLSTLGMLLGITGFLALRSPLLLVALPTLGWRFVSVDRDYWGTGWHYNAVLMPVLFLALVDAVRRLREREDAPGWLRAYAERGVVPAVTAVALTLCATLTLPAATVLRPSTYASTPRSDAISRALALVPDGAVVESNITAMPRLASRTDLYWLGGSPAPPQYLVVDLSYGWSPAPPVDLPAYAAQLHPGHSYRLLSDEMQFAVLELTD